MGTSVGVGATNVPFCVGTAMGISVSAGVTGGEGINVGVCVGADVGGDVGNVGAVVTVGVCVEA